MDSTTGTANLAEAFTVQASVTTILEKADLAAKLASVIANPATSLSDAQLASTDLMRTIVSIGDHVAISAPALRRVRKELFALRKSEEIPS